MQAPCMSATIKQKPPNVMFVYSKSPWWGGFYKRMIGLMKRRLKKMIGRTSLNVVELATMLTEIEATLNS